MLNVCDVSFKHRLFVHNTKNLKSCNAHSCILITSTSTQRFKYEDVQADIESAYDE